MTTWLLDGGEAERQVESRASTLIRVNLGVGQPRVYLPLSLHAAFPEGVARWRHRFSEWVRAWRDSEPFHEAMTEAGGGPIRVLLIGRPFHDDRTRRNAGRRIVSLITHPDLTWHAPEPANASTVASGAVEFLRRRSLGLPTWKDRLPSLYLRVVGHDGLRHYLCLFEGREVEPGERVAYEVEAPLTLDAGSPTSSSAWFAT